MVHTGTYSSSVSNLNIMGLLNFASLLDVGATNRQISVAWTDVVDFILPPNMPKYSPPNSISSLPGGTGGNNKEYRWNVSAGVSASNTKLKLTLSTPEPPPPSEVPEPAAMFLLGSGLLAGSVLSRRWKR
jgi:hypothetical protein